MKRGEARGGERGGAVLGSWWCERRDQHGASWGYYFLKPCSRAVAPKALAGRAAAGPRLSNSITRTVYTTHYRTPSPVGVRGGTLYEYAIRGKLGSRSGCEVYC